MWVEYYGSGGLCSRSLESRHTGNRRRRGAQRERKENEVSYSEMLLLLASFLPGLTPSQVQLSFN